MSASEQPLDFEQEMKLFWDRVQVLLSHAHDGQHTETELQLAEQRLYADLESMFERTGRKMYIGVLKGTHKVHGFAYITSGKSLRSILDLRADAVIARDLLSADAQEFLEDIDRRF